MHNFKEVLKTSSQKLKNISETPDLDSEILLSHILKKDRSFLFANLNKKLTIKQNKHFQKLLNRRLNCEPIAYIINQKEFYGLNFYINKDVLIPRPETETLVEAVLDVLNVENVQEKQSNNSNIYNNLNILDVGTGSGCIAISLAKNIPQAKIYATDISKKALKVARLNARKHRILSRIKFLHGNLLNSTLKKIKFDIIIANLPYLSEKQYKNTKNDIKNYEPKSALIAQNYGMNFYIKLLKQIPLYIKKEGHILFEIDPSFENKIIKKAINILQIKKHQIKIKPDLFRLSRVLIIKF